MDAIPPLVPLFPLPDVVLFPRMPLPLHVFEPRYRKMVKDALAGERVIGMALLQPGWEADYQGRPLVYPIGCAGRIERCEPLDDGRFEVVLRGVTRFRILREEAPREPYRLAAVEPLEDPAGDPEALEQARKRVMAAIGRAPDGPALLVLRSDIDAGLLINAVCQTLGLSPVEKQSLLECQGIEPRAKLLLEILEFKVLEGTFRPGPTKVH